MLTTPKHILKTNSLILNHLWQRTRVKDLDAVVAVVGARGSCKSGTAITIGNNVDRTEKNKQRFRLPEEMYPRNFNLFPGEALPRVVFKPTDFMKLLTKYTLPVGSVIVWDETGVEGDARDFQTKKNKILKRTFETIRERNLIVMLTAPTLQSFDISFRRSMTTQIECRGSMKSPDGREYANVLIKRCQASIETPIIYKKYLKYISPDGVLCEKKEYQISRPPAFLENPYKRYKRLFTTKLYREYLAELESIGVDEEFEQKVDYGNLVDRVMSDLNSYYNFRKEKFVLIALINNLKIEENQAKRLKSLLELKMDNSRPIVEKKAESNEKKEDSKQRIKKYKKIWSN